MMTEGDGWAIAERFRQAAMGMVDWTTALAGLADTMRARVGQLAAVDRHGQVVFNFMSDCPVDEQLAYLAARGYDPAVNPRTRAVLTATPFRAIAERDFMTPALADRTPIYRTVFRDADVPFSVHTRLDSTPDMQVALSLLRPASSGDADADEIRLVDALSPAIGGAVQMAIALGTTMGATLIRTAEHLSGAAILLGNDLDIVDVSPAAETLLRDGRHIAWRHGRLLLRCARAAAMLERSLGRLASEAGRLAGTVPLLLPATDNAAPLTADLCPLPAGRSGPLSRSRALLAIRLPRADPAAGTTLMAAFGLTPAEAAIAVMLMQGATLHAIADRRGTMVDTVRAQLKSIFGKTGVHRQAELVARLRPYC